MTSPLLSLPLELRNMIYREGLILPCAITVYFDEYQHKHYYWHDDLTKSLWHQPALTRTSKQLRLETLDMFYASNSFVLRLFGPSRWPLHQVAHWIRVIGVQNAQAIGQLAVSRNRCRWTGMTSWDFMLESHRVTLRWVDKTGRAINPFEQTVEDYSETPLLSKRCYQILISDRPAYAKAGEGSSTKDCRPIKENGRMRIGDRMRRRIRQLRQTFKEIMDIA